MAALRRSTSLFSQGEAAEAIYFIEEGLIKLTRAGMNGGHIVLAICGPGHLVGDELLSDESLNYYAEAEVLSSATLLRIPRETLKRSMTTNPEMGGTLVSYALEGKLNYAYRVELLCLHDVEYRILYHLAELSKLVKPLDDGMSQLPITQLELADLIGATRETTSTTLNQLERRGLVKLSRRLLTIASPVTLRSAANAKLSQANGSAGGA
ncbi:MAG TPA: Crp/Fnr family transcriptional regulator [Bryobacteraceae bacterium]